nr:MAG: hypothetical protein [Bacteriophage sp.]
MSDKYIKTKKNDLFYNDAFHKKCKKEKVVYAVIEDSTKWAEIRVDADTLGSEVYEKMDDYIKENNIDIFENVKHMISSYLDYGSEDMIHKCYSVGVFTWARVRKEMAPAIVVAVYDILMDIANNKI